MSTMLEEKVVSTYKQLSKIPILTSGKIVKEGKHITSIWTLKELEKVKNIKIKYDYFLKDDFTLENESSFGVDTSNEILSAISPSGKQKAVIREVTDGKNQKKQYLEIWSSKYLLKAIDLSTFDIHGDVYTEVEFGALSWREDESKLVYVAEKKPTKSLPFTTRLPDNDNKNITRGKEFLCREEWGEQIVGRHASVIVSFDVTTEKLSILQGLPESWCPGQVSWSGENVFGLAFDSEPRRMGLHFFTNRPSYCFLLKPNGTFDKLTEKGTAVTSPRVSPDGTSVYWLQRQVGGPHFKSLQLARFDLKTSMKSIIIDRVDKKLDIVNGDFYGIYCHYLPDRCITQDGKFFLFSSPQRLQIKSYAVEIDSGKIWEISYNKTSGSTTVLDVYGSLILASVSSLTTPSQLVIGKLEDVGKSVHWYPIGEIPQSPVPDSEVHHLNLEHKNSTDSVKDFYAIYFGPKQQDSKKKNPLIMFMHGGPHAGSVDAFFHEFAFYNKLGFAVLLVNYRGSFGNGDDSINFIIKRIGKSDVLDCKYAVEEVVKRFPVDEKKITLCGGSHGGFLVAQLSGQYPDAFAAACARNPVIDIAGMYSNTDAPDWCFVETGGEYTGEGLPSEELISKMRECSPIIHAHKVKVPTIVMLGAVDIRLPPHQGLAYYHKLKAQGCKAKVFMYNDNHGLWTLPVEVDNVINTALWFLEHVDG